MSLEFLRQVAAMPLPKSFNAKQDVDAIKVLRKAGLVLALIDEPPEYGARVLAITEAGRSELLEFHYPESPRTGPNERLSLAQAAKRAKEALMQGFRAR